MVTTVSRVDVLLTVDGKRLPQQVRQLSRRVGQEAGAEMGRELNTSFDRQLTNLGEQRLGVLRERMVSSGRSNGRLFGLNLRQAVDNQLKGFVDDIVGDLARIFTFDDGGEQFSRWAKGFDNVGEASRRMAERIAIARDEGRFQGETYDALMDKLELYTSRAREVEDADRRMSTQKLELQRRVERLNLQMGSTTAFRRHVAEVGDIDRAYVDLNRRINELESVGGDRSWADRLRVKLMDLADGFDRSGDSAERAGFKWGSIPHNGRQVILWTTVIIAAFEQLATLSSAVGAGLFVLGAGATSSLVGLGGLIAAFKGFGGDLENLPAGVHEASQAFRDLIDGPLAELQDYIQVTALGQTTDAWRMLGDTIRELTPAFEPLATVIGNLVRDLAENTKPGTEAFIVIRDTISSSADVFDRVVRIAGDFGVALLRAFEGAQPYVDELLDYVDELVTRFDEFTKSDGLDQWYANASEIFGALGDLLDTLFGELNSLIDQESVDRAVELISKLEDSVPFLTEIIDIFGELDVFGIILGIFETLGSILGPILEMLNPIVSIIGEMMTGFQEFGQVLFDLISPIFIPFQLAFEAINLAVEKFFDWLAPVKDQLGVVGEEVGNLGERIWTALEPALGDLYDAFLDLLPEPEALAAVIRDDVIPWIQNMADKIVNEVIPRISDFIGLIEDVIEALGGWDGIKSKLDQVGGAFSTFYSVVNFALSPIRGLIGGISDSIGWLLERVRELSGAAGAASSSAGKVLGGGGRLAPRPMASGAILRGPERILAGEAGMEAIVPLQRPLHLVDPEVRDIAAYAQGKKTADGGPATSGGGLHIGSLIVEDRSGDSRRTANEVVTRIVEYAAG